MIGQKYLENRLDPTKIIIFFGLKNLRVDFGWFRCSESEVKSQKWVRLERLFREIFWNQWFLELSIKKKIFPGKKATIKIQYRQELLRSKRISTKWWTEWYRLIGILKKSAAVVIDSLDYRIYTSFQCWMSKLFCKISVYSFVESIFRILKKCNWWSKMMEENV